VTFEVVDTTNVPLNPAFLIELTLVFDKLHLQFLEHNFPA